MKDMKSINQIKASASRRLSSLAKTLSRATTVAVISFLLAGGTPLGAGVPYISSVSVEGTQADHLTHQCYGLAALLTLPEPNVDYMEWHAIGVDSWSTSWPNPDDWVYSDTWNGSDHTVKVKAINGADNGYYLTYDGSSYSYFCHGCSQGGGGVYIYNP
jgi:hypothetical protein